jgi:chaperonin GroEL
VATISAEDATIGKMIAEIYEKIGVGGIIHWDISKTFEDHYTLGKGITMEQAGLASPYFADMDEKTGQFSNALRWKNAKILITKQKITTAAEFEQLFVGLNASGQKEVVIFCEDYEPTVVPQLVQTRIVQGFKTALVKMPTIFKDHWYADLAATTGATVIDPAAGITFKTMKAEHLGHVANIVIDKENTYLDGTKDVTEHVKSLEADGSDDSMLRVARLNTKTARYYVGATSDSALSYRRLKVEDALHSAYYAIKDGVVPGGGVSLRNCADALGDKTVGEAILAKALLVPEETIARNGGMKEYLGKEDNMGLDTRTGEYVNMFDSGIVDTTSVVMNAVRNAVSVAASVLTCGVIIQFPKQSVTDAIVDEIMTRKP